ncbi:hypothetical protein jhhlp_007514 [Lomentospora prolificans]|uniref:MARVEL domain-containing protein n=1 Tax=Lomentospora prolificans TaxID=41688 RepID=A0A2N3N195_9PEZI|nr:hypothetical protein jhhlp_007514 [Lomentospora prolificans]
MEQRRQSDLEPVWIVTQPPDKRRGRWRIWQYPPSVWGLWIALPILAVASIFEMVLKINAPRANFRDIQADSSGLRPVAQVVESTMEPWPSSIQRGELEMQTVAAALALVEVVALGFFVLRVVRKQPFQIPLNGRIGMLVAIAIIDIFALATLVFIFVVNYRSAQYDADYALHEGEKAWALNSGGGIFTYDQGTFTTETWACGVKDLPTFDGRFGGELSKACKEEQAARYLMIVISAMLLVVFELVFRDKIDGTGLFAVPYYR